MTILTDADLPHLTILFLGIIMLLGMALIMMFWALEQSTQLARLRTTLYERFDHRHQRR